MGSFFKNLRNNAASSSGLTGTSPPKKDPHGVQMTPLEKMLHDSGPVRNDGSDKFFGMENYGNTCYCNSILQCLYYSVPFRESVINYPKRTPIDSLEAALAKNLHYQNIDSYPEAEAAAARQRASAGQSSSRSAGVTPTQPPKPEDKDSPEYKKKLALQTLPLLETKNNAASYGMPESLFTSLKDIFESVVASQSKLGVIRPHHFLDVLRRDHEMFRTAMHQDAHEFLNLLLNEVVASVEAESSKRPEPEKSLQSMENGESDTGSTTLTAATSSGSKSPNTTRWVHELFEGTLTSETQCLTCEKISQRDEVFLDLSVDLDQHSSVTSCLRKFSAEEMLCERNKFHCDNCGGLQEAEKRMKIKRLPRILALHLKRFKYTEDLQRLQKLFHRVVYPYHLRLFNTTDDAEDPDRLYELYAVVVHIGGGPYHGHYIAIIKTEDHGWLLFDDEMVEPVDKNYVRNFFGDRPGLACAYVLFYQQTTLEAVRREQEHEYTAAARSSGEHKDIVMGMNGSPISPALNHVFNFQGPPPPPDEAPNFSPLKHTPTTPQFLTPPERALSSSPPKVPSLPSRTFGTLSSKKSDIQAKRAKAKEEREQKAAERERERAEKQKRKQEQEESKREEAESKAAHKTSKASKGEDDHHQPEVERPRDNGGLQKTLSGSLGRFRRGSRSISQRFSSREKRRSSDLTPQIEAEPDASDTKLSEEPPSNDTQLKMDTTHAGALDIPKEDPAKAKNERLGHGKWKGFGLRKKSSTMFASI
ncbi:hypothetical protein Egran_05899 [Elaphomyces granulatus]|uniref:Ubiquitin carboxyl-terminal hydrolase n=1 Tax=Elaphomyces granulatus TaxID=519963 RepID=A0A232LQC2_9EURO|nr:hypothetical protein Egran_05899 [Elaphomyces granulatus]